MDGQGAGECENTMEHGVHVDEPEVALPKVEGRTWMDGSRAGCSGAERGPGSSSEGVWAHSQAHRRLKDDFEEKNSGNFLDFDTIFQAHHKPRSTFLGWISGPLTF